MVKGLIILVYYINFEVYDYCNCLLKLLNDNYVENIYIICSFLGFVVWVVLYFVLVNICVLVNFDGSFDDFIIFDLIIVCNNGICLKNVNVFLFLLNNDEY